MQDVWSLTCHYCLIETDEDVMQIKDAQALAVTLEGLLMH